MQVGAITQFIHAQGIRGAVLTLTGYPISGVATIHEAKQGDVSWCETEPDNFKGSLLLRDKYAMALVIKEFFDYRRPLFVHTDTKIGEGTVLGGPGFGYVWTGSEYMRWPHIGSLVIEKDVELGANNTVDRGSIGNTVIRRGVKTDNQVHIAHNCEIGEHTLIAAGATISGSVTIGSRCWIGVGCTISNGLKIGDGAVIGAGAVVVKDVPPNECWLGNPARFYKEASDVSRP